MKVCKGILQFLRIKMRRLGTYYLEEKIWRICSIIRLPQFSCWHTFCSWYNYGVLKDFTQSCLFVCFKGWMRVLGFTNSILAPITRWVGEKKIWRICSIIRLLQFSCWHTFCSWHHYGIINNFLQSFLNP